MRARADRGEPGSPTDPSLASLPAASRRLRLKYAALCLAALIAAPLAAEGFLLPFLESTGRFGGVDWHWENEVLNHELRRRNRASREDGVWRSEGLPAGPAKTRARRILVMGDSYVWGDGFANINDVWWRQLQRLLVERGYGEVEVIADGMPGYATRDQVLEARRAIPRYRPDLVIWGYVSNDPDEGLIKRANERLTLRPEALFPELELLYGKGRLEKRRLANGTGDGLSYFMWRSRLLEGENFARYRQTVRELGEVVRESGVPSFALALPQSPDAEVFRARFGPVAPLFEENGIAFVDPLDPFVEKHRRLERDGPRVYTLKANPANGHPGAASTRFFAEVALEALEQRHPGVLGEPAPGRPSPPRVVDWIPAALGVRDLGAGRFAFQYPAEERGLPRMPERVPRVQLNLDLPARLEAIELSGAGLVSARLGTTSVDPAFRFDTGMVTEHGRRSGSQLRWELGQAEGINTLRLSATFAPGAPQRTLEARLVEAR